MAKTGSGPARKRGRPKGSRNQITNEAKQAILMAFDRIGGVDRLVEWIKADPANEAVYWGRIFLRLLPRAPAEPVPEPEAPPPVTGALVWKTPDWAKAAMTGEAFRRIPESSGTALAQATTTTGRSGRGHDPPDGEGA